MSDNQVIPIFYRYVNNRPEDREDPKGLGVVTDAWDWLTTAWDTIKNPHESAPVPGTPSITTPGAVGGAVVKCGYGAECVKLKADYQQCVINSDDGIDDPKCEKIREAMDKVCTAAAAAPDDFNP